MEDLSRSFDDINNAFSNMELAIPPSGVPAYPSIGGR